VIAHPWGRGSHVGPERFRELKAAGLQGIEVDHQEHDEKARRELRLIAHLDLVATGSSDYHGTRKENHELGCNTTAEHEYLRLQSLWMGVSAPADMPIVAALGSLENEQRPETGDRQAVGARPGCTTSNPSARAAEASRWSYTTKNVTASRTASALAR
jgi:hypothetical protein